MTLLFGRLLLALVFIVAGCSKLADIAGSRTSLRDFGVPQFLVPSLAWVLPGLELLCAITLLDANWATWGAAGSTALLMLFTAAITANLARGRRPDCHCFGQLQSSPIGRTTVVRNVVLLALAGLILTQGPGLALSESSRQLANMYGVPAVILVVVVICQSILGGAAIYQLLLQNGRILRRLDAVEAKVGIVAENPEPAARALPVGAEAPGFSLADLDGGTVSLESLSRLERPVLLLFTEPGCGACDALLPDVARWQRELADRLHVALISRGNVERNRQKMASHGLEHVLIQKDREVAERYNVTATPGAVLVIGGRIGSQLAVGPAAIRDLVQREAMPLALKKGARVTPLRLRDLNGGTVDLATPGSRRALLVFWNPSCGFCRAMLDDLKEVEDSRRAPDAPELVIISAGSPKANRDQGFRSRVLLDPHFEAGKLFGVSGTPAAVMVDAEGKVASEVGVGADQVLALAEAVPGDSFLRACLALRRRVYVDATN